MTRPPLIGRVQLVRQRGAATVAPDEARIKQGIREGLAMARPAEEPKPALQGHQFGLRTRRGCKLEEKYSERPCCSGQIQEHRHQNYAQD